MASVPETTREPHKAETMTHCPICFAPAGEPHEPPCEYAVFGTNFPTENDPTSDHENVTAPP